MGVSAQGFTPLAALPVHCIPNMYGPFVPCIAGAGRSAQYQGEKYLVHSTCSSSNSVTSVSHLKTDRQSLEPRSQPELAFRYCRHVRSIILLNHHHFTSGQ